MLKIVSTCTLLLSLILPLGAQSAADTPTEVVSRFQSALISVMKDAQQLGYEGRYKRLKPAIEESHDLARIAQIVSARFGDQVTDAQKKQFAQTFSELSIATYAAQFDGYSGETFKTVGERKLENGTVLVQSVMNQKSGDKINFDYVLWQKDGQWRIINIVVDGVSDLAVKRGEYAGILKSEGMDALLARLRDKIAQYAKQGQK